MVRVASTILPPLVAEAFTLRGLRGPCGVAAFLPVVFFLNFAIVLFLEKTLP